MLILFFTHICVYTYTYIWVHNNIDLINTRESFYINILNIFKKFYFLYILAELITFILINDNVYMHKHEAIKKLEYISASSNHLNQSWDLVTHFGWFSAWFPPLFHQPTRSLNADRQEPSSKNGQSMQL